MQQFRSLPNYIAMHRKTAGLSQVELAIMLGLEDRKVLSKYELAERMPEIRTLIAMEIVFDEPLQSIFAGIAQEIREEMPGRARAILETMGDKPGPDTSDKLATLSRVAHLDEEDTISW